MRIAISIFGKDRPGIIAALTINLTEHGANIEDASMTLLQDHFAMIMVIDCDRSQSELEQSLLATPELANFSIAFSDELSNDVDADNQHSIAKYIFHLAVSDTPGIVARVTEVLTRHRANVVDCATRKNNDTGVFSMILDVDVPLSDEDNIVSELSSAVNDFSGDVVFQRVDDVDL